MVNYNPNLPHILGQEWVPIRDFDLTFDENTNSFETGHTFTLNDPATVGDVRFYINDFAYNPYYNQGFTATIYPRDEEALSGPVQKVTIPCTGGGITGTGVTPGVVGYSVAQSLSNPGTGPTGGIIFNFAQDLNIIAASFGTDQAEYQFLADKRILGVTLVTAYRIVSNSDEIDPDLTFNFAATFNDSGLTSNEWEFQPLFADGAPALDSRITRRDKLGNVSLFAGVATSTTVSYTYPWTYAELNRFNPDYGAGSTVAVIWTNSVDSPGPAMYVYYMALEVFYCEETRVAYGTNIFNAFYASPVTAEDRYNIGANPIRMFNIGGTDYPTLSPGQYTVTITQANLGDNIEAISNVGPHPQLNAVRELYALENSFDTIRLNLPFPMEDQALGKSFSKEETLIVPQISVHYLDFSGYPFPEVHAYGRQVVAQVWGDYYAEQDLNDGPVDGDPEYPWVRYYARRWGDTTVPLTLTGEGSLAAFSVSLTPDEFDALPALVDDWKEITLRFDPAPSMGAVVDATWRWTASGELAGNRWEILGACAPALSGTVGDLYALSPNQLTDGTYYEPNGGDQQLIWYPQGVGGPPITGVGVSDETSDAVILFGQDMPAISGFTITIESQALSGIGQNCDVDPCCIPNEIFYHQLTWGSLADEIQESDFGYYQLQRLDEVDSDWETIMKSTSVTGEAFNDFEARVGILTSYRLRVVDLYGFEGPWTDIVTSTIPEPGVDGGECILNGHLLMFTSNERQCGQINLAYSSVWFEERVQESFNFPEAGFVQMQPMYDRDFFTAFRPLERGGEQFTRTLLVQAAAISPPTLADFTSLRDMAWEDVNYICVRDEEGNRWFATVAVPSGTVLNNRRLYMAPVQIAEVTRTPTPVDVDWCLPPQPPPAFSCDELIASDSFTRTESGDWGTADLGGAWTEEV